MSLDVTTPALLFPAISLLFLSYTNRFLHLASLVRKLYANWLDNGSSLLEAQIQNLKKRITLIRAMQLFGAFSLFACVISMVAVILSQQHLGWISFCAALVLMGISLVALIWEITISGGALSLLLNEMRRTRR